MAANVKALSDRELENLIQNHRNQGATDRPVYTEALEERACRKGQGLNFDKTLSAVRKAARERRYLSYKELSDHSGAEWSKVHWAMNAHLDDLLEYCHRRGLPLLSALVVNKANVATGQLDDDALKGFIAGARRLGYIVSSEREFFREQQRLSFDWGSSEPEPL